MDQWHLVGRTWTDPEMNQFVVWIQIKGRNLNCNSVFIYMLLTDIRCCLVTRCLLGGRPSTSTNKTMLVGPTMIHGETCQTTYNVVTLLIQWPKSAFCLNFVLYDICFVVFLKNVRNVTRPLFKKGYETFTGAFKRTLTPADTISFQHNRIFSFLKIVLFCFTHSPSRRPADISPRVSCCDSNTDPWILQSGPWRRYKRVCVNSGILQQHSK